MTIQFCAQTDPGREREKNEDALAFDGATGLCVLADGMGGHNAGQVASGMAIAFIDSEMRAWLTRTPKAAVAANLPAALTACIKQANEGIFNMSAGNRQYKGMGTTLVMGVFHGDGLTVAHLGDSRCYRLRGSQFLQITKDHSLCQEQIDSGLLTPAQAMANNQNLITRALGVDLGVHPEIHLHRVERGDVYMLCSDGLTDMVPDAEIAALLQGPETLEAKAERLVFAANASGGRDNISVLLARVADAPMRQLMGAIRGIFPGKGNKGA